MWHNLFLVFWQWAFNLVRRVEFFLFYTFHCTAAWWRRFQGIKRTEAQKVSILAQYDAIYRDRVTNAKMWRPQRTREYVDYVTGDMETAYGSSGEGTDTSSSSNAS
jgi:hypothetical protein